MQLDTDIRYIKGIGEARARSLEKLGIRDLAGLVSYFPRAYEDRSSFKPIAALEDGESVCVRAMVAEEPQLVRIRGGMEMVKLRAVDETGTLFINFFNRAYVRSQLHRGQSLVSVSYTHLRPLSARPRWAAARSGWSRASSCPSQT